MAELRIVSETREEYKYYSSKKTSRTIGVQLGQLSLPPVCAQQSATKGTACDAKEAPQNSSVSSSASFTC